MCIVSAFIFFSHEAHLYFDVTMKVKRVICLSQRIIAGHSVSTVVEVFHVTSSFSQTFLLTLCCIL